MEPAAAPAQLRHNQRAEWAVGVGRVQRRFAEFLRQVRDGSAGAVGNLKVRRGGGEGERGFTTK